MKKVLSVQSLSCFGKSSLTVALPVLSAMGCSCTVLPTAVLSTHTGYPDPYKISMTQDISQIAAHWQAQGIGFDGVMTGYLADPMQAEAVVQVVDTFRKTVVVDPAMGDSGKLYRGLCPAHVDAMKLLCRKANVLIPNVTEAALLTGLPYRASHEESYLAELMQGMLGFGADAVVITGVSKAPGKTGFVGTEKGASFSYETEVIGKAFHGTGDLFCAVLTGSLMAEKSLSEAAKLAATFVERVLQNTHGPEKEGFTFEPQLPWLWQANGKLIIES